jgi:hypothetical protein
LTERPSVKKKPSTADPIPPTSSHIDLSVGLPAKNRETSELNESDSLMPKMTSATPPANGTAALTSTMANPLGSAANPECQIDALPQSWSILPGAGDPARSRTALEAVMERLVRREARLSRDKAHQSTSRTSPSRTRWIAEPDVDAVGLCSNGREVWRSAHGAISVLRLENSGQRTGTSFN